MGDEHDSWLGGLGVDVSGILSSPADTVEGAASSVVDTASNVVQGAGEVASSAASTVSDAAGQAWEGAKSAAGEVADTASNVVEGAGEVASSAASTVSDAAGQAWDGAKSAAGEVADFGKGVYGQMKEDAAYVKKGENLVEGGVDWLEDQAKGATAWAADQAKGIPVLEQVADAGKAVVDFNVDVTGGALKGATGLVGGVLSAAANPVDTAKALESMAEHIPITGAPLKALHGAYDVATGEKTAGQVANEVLNPMDDLEYWGNVGKAVASPMIKAVEDGKPGEAVGEVGIIAAAMLTGAGEVGAAAAS